MTRTRKPRPRWMRAITRRPSAIAVSGAPRRKLTRRERRIRDAIRWPDPLDGGACADRASEILCIAGPSVDGDRVVAWCHTHGRELPCDAPEVTELAKRLYRGGVTARATWVTRGSL